MFKKLLSAVLSAAMIFSAVTFLPAEKSIVQPETAMADATEHTADDAIAWCKSQIGRKVDNGQCVGFINGYMDYLGVNHYNYLVSDAADFRYERFCPPGWQQKAGVQPQKGDILIYTGGAGHVAVYESDYATYHQNYNGQLVSKVTSLKYNEFVNPYWGVLRPNFKSPIPDGHMMSEAEAAGQTIPDGDYWIFSELDPWVYIEPPGNEILTENGIKVQTWKLTPNVYDVWTVEYQNNGFYKLMQKDSKMSMHVLGNSLKCGTIVNFWERNGATGEDFSIRKTDHGYTLQSRCNGFFLDIENGSTELGTNVRVWEGNGSQAQSFCFVPYDSDDQPISDGTYNIRSAAAADSYFDAAGAVGEYKTGTNIQVQKGKQDNFVIKYAGDGWYEIYEESSGLAITVDTADAYMKNTTNILLYEDKAFRRQLWRFVPTADGHYNIITKLNGYYMNLESGQNVSQLTPNGNISQKWDFIPVVNKGDVNNDGKVAIADLVLLKKWLLTETDALPDWKLADVCEDGVIDVYDVVALRKLCIG